MIAPSFWFSDSRAEIWQNFNGYSREIVLKDILLYNEIAMYT